MNISGEETVSGGAPTAGGEDTRRTATSILVVEDDTLVRMVIGDDLRDRGYRVVEGSSVEEGRKYMLADEPIALVVTDINLPGTNGLEFAAWLKREFPDVKVVLVSGAPENEPAARAFGPFLQKPFAVETLARIIETSVPG